MRQPEPLTAEELAEVRERLRRSPGFVGPVTDADRLLATLDAARLPVSGESEGLLLRDLDAELDGTEDWTADYITTTVKVSLLRRLRAALTRSSEARTEPDLWTLHRKWHGDACSGGCDVGRFIESVEARDEA